MLNTMTSVVFIILTIFSATLNHLITASTEEIEPIELRIKHLKRQIFEDIEGLGNTPYEFDHYKDMYDYVDNSNKPITPISEDDERKLHDRYKQPELKPTTTPKFVASPEKVDKKIDHLRSRKQKKKTNVETFYRRMDFNANERDRPQKWTHCLELIAPFLNGYLKNVTETKKVFVTDHKVRRLRQLLSANMTDATADEIKTTLYEISNLQIRLYQWDVAAVKALINVVTQGQSRGFRGLKYGVKRIFASWKLNTSNLTRILTQTRLFRPPCMQITGYGGSTVTPKTIRFPKPKDEKKVTCVYRNSEDC